LSQHEGPPDVIRFGVFELDVCTSELRKQGLKTRLAGQSFQVLKMLVERPGELVTREEMKQKLWPGESFGDFDKGLNAAVNRVREALGDTAENPRFVETLPRRGYRFIAFDGRIPIENSKGLCDTEVCTTPSAESGGDVSNAERPNALFLGAGHWILLGCGAITIAIFFALSIGTPLIPRVLRYSQVTNDGVPKGPALVTDGSRLYFTEDVYYSEAVKGGGSIVQVSTAGGQVMIVSSPLEHMTLLDFAPIRAELLALSAQGTQLESAIWVVPVTGGAARRISNLQVNDATFSRDGETLVFGKGQDLYVAKADGSGPRRLATLAGNVFRPRLSPDGRFIRFTVYEVSTGLQSLWESSSDGAHVYPLFPDKNQRRDECCGIWTPDGKYFLFQATQDGLTGIWALREDKSLFRRSGAEPVQITTGPMNFLAPSPSLDGKRLFVIGVQPRGELMRFDLKSQQFSSYLSGISAHGLDFSRDGQLLAYVSYPEGTLWRSYTNGSHRLQLTDNTIRTYMPHWSPDGKQIAFMGSKAGGVWKIYIVPAQGGKSEELMDGNDFEEDPGWSADGKSIVFSDSPLSLSPSIHVVNLQTRQMTSLPGSQGLFSPKWSPDGRFIVALSKDSQKLLLYQTATDQWQVLLQGLYFSYPTWSRDGEYIYFCNLLEGGTPFYRLRIDGHKLERVASVELPGGLAASAFGAWKGLAPDGSPLVLRDASIQEIYALELAAAR
jgi:Tol biopolymer transport system component/DNA-binding winged helix-turn-helix (wHTH) protein